jgi:uncharacterized glyoxalase superfamily protein PhnB
MEEVQNQASAVIPVLRYEDAPAMIEWLCQAFGFERLLVVPGEGGAIAHAQLRHENGVLMLSSPRDDGTGLKTARELGGVNQCVHVVVDDPDAHHDRAKAAGAEIVNEPREQDRDYRGYLCRDPERNLFTSAAIDPNCPAASVADPR